MERTHFTDMPTPTAVITKATSISGVTIPESKLAREATELVLHRISAVFNHSSRVFYFASLAGKRLGLSSTPSCFILARCSTIWG